MTKQTKTSMYQHKLKTLLFCAATALGLAASAHADVPIDDQTFNTTAVGQGLLGQQFANLSYSYIDLDAPVHADNYGLAFNEPLKANLDALFNYDYTQSGLVAGNRLSQHAVTAGLRVFRDRYTWGKPYVEARAGYAWQKFGGTSDNSFVWGAGAGVEFQVAPAVTVTPSVEYTDAPDLASSGNWAFGVKANYWIDSQWSVTAGISRDDDHNNTFTLGTNFRY